MKSGSSVKKRQALLRPLGAAVGILAVLATTTAPSLAAECTASPDAIPQRVKAVNNVESAKHVRHLQSELMVAALGCGLRKQYNAFAVSYRSDLKQNGKLLKAHFRAKHGSGGEKALNSYVTALANKASMRMAANADYCQQTRTAFDQLLSDQPAMGLEQLAVHYVLNDSDLRPLAAAASCEEDAQLSQR